MMHRILCLVVGLLLGGSIATAATISSAQSGNWSAPATWTGNTVPTSADAVIITAGLTVTIDIPDAACLTLQLGGTLAGAGRGTITFTSGSQLTTSGFVTVGAANNSGSIIMAAGGKLICQGFVQNGVATWTPGTGTVELTASNLLPNNGITSFNNLTINGGTTTLNANLSVAGDLVITSGATLNCDVKVLTVTGNWINNGTFTGSTGNVIFDRNGNQTVTGTGANNFNTIRVNMGTSNANTLEVLSTNFSAADPFLTISNGTFKMSGSFTFSNTFILGPLYNIQPSAGLWINNPNVTVTPQAGGISVRGILHLSAGTYNVGTSVDNNLDFVAGAAVIVDGGTLNIAGHFGRNSPASTVSYTQSAGTVTVVTQGSTDITNAGFDLGTVGCSFSMSGGTLIVARTTSNATDYLNIATSNNVTGGTLQFGDANTPSGQVFRVQSQSPMGTLLISNATGQAVKPTVQLVTSSIILTGGLTIQSGTTFNANGLNVSLAGDWSNSGTFTAGPSVTFSGSAAQSLTSGGESFNGLTISKPAGTLTLNAPVNVNGAFTLSQGTIAIGTNTLTLNGGVSGAGTLTSGPSGTVSYNSAGAGQVILAANYGNLSLNNVAKTFASSGITGISGIFTPGSSSSHTITGSTISFNGGVQSVPAFAYNNLTFGGSGVKTGSGGITVAGSLTVPAGVTFTGATTLTLAGAAHTNDGTLSTGTLVVGPGAGLTNNGTLTTSTALTGAGSVTQGAGSTLNIGGISDITSLTASSSGNTVNYTGATQSVRGISYNALALSGSGAPSLTGVTTIGGNLTLSGTVSAQAAAAMTIGGNVTIGSGTSFDAGAFTHSIKGNFAVNGLFTPSTSTMSFSGIAPQSLSAASFNGLTINNPAGVELTGDVAVGGSLGLTSGVLSLGGHALSLNGGLTTVTGALNGVGSSTIAIGGSTPLVLPAVSLGALLISQSAAVTLGGDVTVNGSVNISGGSLATGSSSLILGSGATITEAAGHPVVGTVSTSRTITATAGTETFGNIGVDLSLNGTAPGNTSVIRKTGTASTGTGHSSIHRYFDIAPATNSGLKAGLTFHYDSTEINLQNPAAFELFRSRDNGSTWNDLGGNVNAAARTVSVTGLNDLSRWTLADTSNRIGVFAAPFIASLSPASKNAGDPGFTLTVNGSEFISGKSVVVFHGIARATTFVNVNQLTAVIPASELLVVGSISVSVLTGGALTSNTMTFTVTAGTAAKVTVETASDGSGVTVPGQTIASGSPMTVYAISRDSLNNFVANVAASSYSLVIPTGGIVPGDLVAAANGKSAVFTARLVGSAKIAAVSGTLQSIPSGVIGVIPGAAKSVAVETFADGSGNTAPAETLVVGASRKVYAVTRDSVGNFIANVAAATWSVQNSTGGFVAGDLVAAVDSKSAVFTAHAAGSGSINATLGGLTAVSSGRITVLIVNAVANDVHPLAYELKQNYPNPFNPTTNIDYSVVNRQVTTIVVYDALGREVTTLVNEVKDPGSYTVRFNAGGLASGMYFYRIHSGNFVETKRLILLR